MRQFGLAFGTAYQIYDDCIDLFGSEADAGKSLGTDLAKGKLTLPVLLVWERADASDRERLRSSVQTWQADAMPWMAQMLAKYETLPASLECLRQYLETAQRMLLELPPSAGRTGLYQLTEYLARQTSGLKSASQNGV